MKKLAGLVISVLALAACQKTNTSQEKCDLQQVYLDNSKKVTIASGIWGTVSSLEGNCMPTEQVSSSSCSNCPVQRTVKVYEYTTLSNAITSDPYKRFFDSFNAQLVAQSEADEKGFFQLNIPPGHYSIVTVEDGKLYAESMDGQGGLNPFTLSSGVQNVNIRMTYKAVF